MTGRNAQRQLNEEAAEWLLTLHDTPTPEAQAAFCDWLARSADHMQTFLEMTAVDHDLDGLDGQRQVDLDTLVAEVRVQNDANVVAMEAGAKSAGTPIPAPRTWRRKAMAVAAALIVAVAGLSVWTALAPTRYETEIGEQRTVKLEDGSVVQLNTRSHIEVDFTPDTREVRLLDGEALFNVERDPARPFRVLARTAKVEVLGTQFNIYQRPEETTVSVANGRVRVAGMVLAAGEQADVDAGGRAAKRSDPDIARALAWRQRQLEFDHTPLAEVAAQFNRYNKTQIHIVDAAVRARELEGIFNADQPQSLLDFLALEKDLRIEHREEAILIRLR
jgi:transmembrane sensor